MYSCRGYGGGDILVEVARMCVMLVMIVQFPVVHFPARSALYAVFQLAVKRVCNKRKDGDDDDEQSPTRLHETAARPVDGGDTDELSVSDNELDEGRRPGAPGLLFTRDPAVFGVSCMRVHAPARIDR